MSDIYYLAYKDDGPDGPCGQSCATTNPWSRLYIFTDRDDMKEFADIVKSGKYSGRRRPRITDVWQECEYTNEVFRKVKEDE